ncbi:sulfur carrier protein ThiS [Pseudonocardia endophytica]|uniref:Sulfur carrier protein n=1 Tax=Pseudonocardia endophytica TaxID=401976 RepID=A0A4R1HIB4_PSEEN|nr:sulfur carrier protein ThiS [Pseudonocardia endophytica]TCK20050.1 sulfur carrier protein [Pseudonocardia endophytica]
MRVWINGAAHDLDGTSTVADAMRVGGFPERGVAVAVDGAVVPRARWTATELDDGARLEVLTAVQGG